MGLLDKLLGRTKKAAGDDESSLMREGMHQEMEGAAEERASDHEAMAQDEPEGAAEHHAAQSDETTPPA